jgi:membrane fusion protein (multidrug efflux system)
MNDNLAQHEAMTPDPPRTPSGETPPPRARPRLRTALLAAGAVVAVIGLIYVLHSRHFETTDDAQVDGDISNISPRVPGTIARVHVVENQEVAAGEVLAEIDTADLEVSLAQAKAAVAQAEAQLEAEHPTVLITRASNAAALTNASSDTVSAAAGLSAAEKDVGQLAARLIETQANSGNAELERARGEQLWKQNAIPRAELDRRETLAVAAAAVVDGTRHQLAAARARVDQQKAQLVAVKGRLAEVESTAPREVESRQASVLSRRANLELAGAQERQAELNLGYGKIRTPVRGIVARKAVAVGDHVGVGQQLVAITQTTDVWVKANYRETQIERMRPGQTASVHVDALDRGFSGVVESLGGATGSRLSVLPPENASGNYVKVVQRIPVRIRFDRGQEGLERLRPGMSVESKVRISP